MPNITQYSFDAMNCLPTRIYPDIVRLDLQDYVIARDAVISRMQAQLGDACAYFQFGSIRVPGISDYDMLIICEDSEWKRTRLCAESIISGDGLCSYVFIHPPVVVGRSAVKSLCSIHTLADAQFITGRKDLAAAFEGVLIEDSSTVVMARHALWNSFIRKHSAMRLHNRNVPLRVALLLYNNLLMSAEMGNKLLVAPKVIHDNLVSFRASIMSTPCFQWESLMKSALADVVQLLRSIDRQLDLDHNNTFSQFTPSGGFLWAFMQPNTLLVDNIEALQDTACQLLLSKPMRGIRVIEMPKYTFALVSPLCRHLHLKMHGNVGDIASGEHALESDAYRAFIKDCESFFDSSRHLNDFDYMKTLVLPFGASLDRLSIRDFILFASRLAALDAKIGREH